MDARGGHTYISGSAAFGFTERSRKNWGRKKTQKNNGGGGTVWGMMEKALDGRRRSFANWRAVEGEGVQSMWRCLYL